VRRVVRAAAERDLRRERRFMGCGKVPFR